MEAPPAESCTEDGSFSMTRQQSEVGANLAGVAWPLGARASVGVRSRGLLRWLGSPVGVAVSVTSLFIVVSIVWAASDVSFPNADNAKQLNFAFLDWDLIRGGDWLGPFKVWTQYPPLPHMVGALGALVFGPSIKTSLILETLVFVPLLALGCYGTAKIAFDRTVAPFAVVFALAAPFVISAFHVFLVDAPETAIAALSVWLLLATDRWRRPVISALAGLAVALGLYTKPTFVFFVAGLIAMMVIRGGWRQWRGLLIFSAVTLVLVEPWYFYHWNDILGLTNGFTGSAAPGTRTWYGAVLYPEPFTLKNLAWYGWSTINQQLLLPLTLMFVGGVVAAVVWLARHGRRDSYIPELLAGGLVSWILVSGINLDDPRYSLPALVYVAVFGTWWIGRLGRAPRIVAAGALTVVFIFNSLQVNEEFPSWNAAIHTPASVASPIQEWTFTIARPGGYFSGKPTSTGAPTLALLRAVRAEGYDLAVFDASTLNDNTLGGFILDGQHMSGVLFALSDLAHVAGLKALLVGSYSPGQVGPHAAFFYRADSTTAHSAPCVRTDGVYGIYVGAPTPGSRRQCPPGFPRAGDLTTR
jgi:4-amino-4-deoxy-L-arabinose transferase-like glycosyltransferase